MAAYNLNTARGCKNLLLDRKSELAAIKRGSWPRDINDVMRWSAPQGTSPKAWAARMCKAEIEYVKARMKSGRCKPA